MSDRYFSYLSSRTPVPLNRLKPKSATSSSHSAMGAVDIVNQYYNDTGIHGATTRGLRLDHELPVTRLHQLRCGRQVVVNQFLSFFPQDRSNELPYHFFVVPGQDIHMPENLTERLVLELESLRDHSVYRNAVDGRLQFLEFPNNVWPDLRIHSFQTALSQYLNLEEKYEHLQEFYDDHTYLHQYDYIVIPFKIDVADIEVSFMNVMEWLVLEFCHWVKPTHFKARFVFMLSIVDTNQATMLGLFKKGRSLYSICNRLATFTNYFLGFQVFYPIGNISFEELDAWLRKFIKDEETRIRIIKTVHPTYNLTMLTSEHGLPMTKVDPLFSAIVDNNQPRFS